MDASTNPSAWEALKPGDTIYLIAPSTPVDKGTVEYATKMFADMGLKVKYSPDISKPYYNWGDTVEHRADQIIDALQTPGVKAIYSLEGGEGASEVVAELKKREAELLKSPNRGIPLIGYSDTTFLHHYLGERGIVSPVQGPVPAYLATNDKEEYGFGARTPEQIAVAQKNIESFRHFLMDGQASEPPITLQPLNVAAKRIEKMEGTLVGGNDQIAAVSRFTTHGAHAPIHAAAEKPILLLEGKSLQEMQDTLTVLKESGDLKRYQGIVLGKYYTNQEDPNPAFPSHQVSEVLKKVGVDESMPVFYGAPFGHPRRGAEMKPVPLYTHTAITTSGDAASMTIDRSGSKQDLDTRAAISPVAPAIAPASVSQEKSSAIFEVKFDQTLMSSVNQLQKQNIAGKDVVLHFDMDEKKTGNAQAAINPVHFILMPLIASGKLKDAKSITISANADFAPEFKEWLKDFASRQLPGVPVEIGHSGEREMPQASQQPDPVSLKKNPTPVQRAIAVALDPGEHDHNTIAAPAIFPAQRPFVQSAGQSPANLPSRR